MSLHHNFSLNLVISKNKDSKRVIYKHFKPALSDLLKKMVLFFNASKSSLKIKFIDVFVKMAYISIQI